MSILFNDLVTLRERSGVGSYALELLRHLPKEIEITRLSETFVGSPLKVLSSRPPKGQGKGRLHSVLQQYLSLTTGFGGYELYHEPDAIPFPSKIPTVATVHDLSVTLFPEWHPPHRVERFKRELPRVIEETKGFFADSYATKKDMVEHWRVPADKIEVAWLAPRPAFRPVPLPKERKSYFLFLGTVEPRKNIRGLLDAHRALPPSFREKFPLYVAGGAGWGDVDLKGSTYLGYLDDKKLVEVLCGATALVYPSFYEGFGLPPLEAMACGVPVISSHKGSLEEVVEDAALIIDPNSPEEITDAMVLFAEKEEMREIYRQKGLARAATFSWATTAQTTLQAYRKWLS